MKYLRKKIAIADVSEEAQENKFPILNLLVLILSIYLLISLLIDLFFDIPTEISKVLNAADNVICVFFLIEFCVRFYHAENKLQFMKWGWIDLVASIPNLPFLRAGRILRIIRLLRVIRAFRSVKHFMNRVYQNKAQGLFSTIVLFAVLLLIFSCVSILLLEKDAPNSNIKTAGDAMWWAYVTITTVGYGDHYPVTMEGRILACILMTTGIAIFGTFTAYVSSWFLAEKKA